MTGSFKEFDKFLCESKETNDIFIACFLVNGVETMTQNKDFVSVLVSAIKKNNLINSYLSEILITSFREFFLYFVVLAVHTEEECQILFKIAFKIDASLEWLKTANNVYDILTDPYDVLKYGQYLYVAKEFAKHRELFCKTYFQYMYGLMMDIGKRLLAPISKDFLRVIPYVYGITNENFIAMFEEYVNLQRNVGSKTIR